MTFKGPFQLKQFCDSKGATAPFHALPGCLRAVFCVWSSQCSVERERERGSLRVAFPSLGQIMKTTVFDDVLEVLMSFTVKKLMVPDSERSI